MLRPAILLALLAIGISVRTGPSLSGADPASSAVAAKNERAAPKAAGEVVALAPVLEQDRAAQAAEAALLKPYSRTLGVGKGDTLMKLLVKAGIDRAEAHGAINAMRPLYNPRRLKPGQQIVVNFAPSDSETGDDRFIGMALDADVERMIQVSRRGAGDYWAFEEKKTLARVPNAARGSIRTSLFAAATEADIPLPVLIEMIRAFSYDVDFQRDIQPGDGFEAMYETLENADGATVAEGDVLYAKLTLSGVELAIYRYTMTTGEADYFDPEGQSVRKTLMRTPIDGARLSSRYGRRKHPILKFTRVHRGVDFAAPPRTPIYAAGDGVIDYAGSKGNLGRYVRIRHNIEYKTGYAHMRSYAKGIRRGKRVKQGQVIGYVGSSGLSTGPHLHYEVQRNGRKVNPLKIKLPAGEKLKDAELARFLEVKTELQRRFAEIAESHRLAEANSCAERRPQPRTC